MKSLWQFIISCGNLSLLSGKDIKAISLLSGKDIIAISFPLARISLRISLNSGNNFISFYPSDIIKFIITSRQEYYIYTGIYHVM
jgi:hypothetical protein